MDEAALHPTDDIPAFEVRALACTRGERRLFRDVKFSLNAGEALLVEGPNGSGKTSLLRILCGLGLADEGEVRWRGRDADESRAEFLSEVAYVGHANGIKLDLTAIENLAFSRSLGRARTVGIAEALKQIGLQRFADTPCRKLSAGQRRRVALARLLVLDAALWLLDEPLTALDTRSVARIEEMLQAHLDRGGMAILTTHRAIDLGAHRVRRLSLGA